MEEADPLSPDISAGNSHVALPASPLIGNPNS